MEQALVMNWLITFITLIRVLVPVNISYQDRHYCNSQEWQMGKTDENFFIRLHEYHFPAQ